MIQLRGKDLKFDKIHWRSFWSGYLIAMSSVVILNVVVWRIQ